MSLLFSSGKYVDPVDAAVILDGLFRGHRRWQENSRHGVVHTWLAPPPIDGTVVAAGWRRKPGFLRRWLISCVRRRRCIGLHNGRGASGWRCSIALVRYTIRIAIVQQGRASLRNLVNKAFLDPGRSRAAAPGPRWVGHLFSAIVAGRCRRSPLHLRHSGAG